MYKTAATAVTKEDTNFTAIILICHSTKAKYANNTMNDAL